MNQRHIKTIENTLKGILLLALFISPLIFTSSLYFPYVSGKAYFFRLLIELALIPWVILLFKDSKYRPNLKNPLVIALLVFVVALIITAFTGVDFRHSFFSNMERSDGIIQYIHWVLYFLMAISVFKTKKDWQIVLSVFILTALVNCFYAFTHYKEQPQLFGLLGNSSYLSGLLIFAIGFCLLFLINSFKPFIKKTPVAFTFLITVLVLLFAVALILTKTRGVYLGVFLGFSIFVILANFSFWKKSLPTGQAGKKMIILLNVFLLILLVFSVLIFVYKDSQFVKKFSIISRVAHTFQSTSVADRLSEWQIAIKGFKDKPILGWGPENFDVVANKYYNYRVGLYEPWFDRPHNQALQYLAEGGIVLFVAYLFLIAMVFRSISKIYKKEKILASLLSAIYIAYIVQSLILFDVLPIFLGLFTLLAFIYFQSEPSRSEKILHSQGKIGSSFYIGTSILIVAVFILIRTTVFIPFQGSRLIIESLKATITKDYKTQNLVLDKLFLFKSPYLYADVRRATSWDFAQNVLDKEIKPENTQEVIGLYDRIMPEMENWVKYRPVDPQAYYVLGASYRIGFEKLGKIEDLSKAEIIFEKALALSDLRIEYIDQLGQILISENKFDELDKLMKNFVAGIDPNDPYRYLSLGNSYLMQSKYDLAFGEYKKAQELGQLFWNSERDYSRYLQSAQQLKDWQKVVEMVKEYLKNRGEDADNLYNLAVAYYYLGDKQKAQEYFNKAAALKSEFEQFRSIFFN